MSMSSSVCIRSTSTIGTVPGPGHREPQRAQVVLAARRVVQQSLVDGWRPSSNGDAVALDRLQRAAADRTSGADQRRTRLQASQDPGLVAEVMEERFDAQIAVCTGHLAVRSHDAEPDSDCRCAH